MTKFDANIELIKLQIEKVNNKSSFDKINKPSDIPATNEIEVEATSEYQRMVNKAKLYAAKYEAEKNQKKPRGRWNTVTTNEDGKLTSTQDYGEIFKDNLKDNVCRLRGQFELVQDEEGEGEEALDFNLFEAQTPFIKFENENLHSTNTLDQGAEQSELIETSLVNTTLDSLLTEKKNTLINCDTLDGEPKTIFSTAKKICSYEVCTNGNTELKKVINELVSKKADRGEITMKAVFSELLKPKAIEGEQAIKDALSELFNNNKLTN